jgi:hypothetical protein
MERGFSLYLKFAAMLLTLLVLKLDLPSNGGLVATAGSGPGCRPSRQSVKDGAGTESD